jgi:hypothetical protein
MVSLQGHLVRAISLLAWRTMASMINSQIPCPGCSGLAGCSVGLALLLLRTL